MVSDENFKLFHRGMRRVPCSTQSARPSPIDITSALKWEASCARRGPLDTRRVLSVKGDMTQPRVVRAPRGARLNCKGWHQEAALRCLMNNLDPDVAERPEDLVVYGGRGKAARNWSAFEAIVRELQQLEADETLLVQSGKPV